MGFRIPDRKRNRSLKRPSKLQPVLDARIPQNIQNATTGLFKLKVLGGNGHRDTSVSCCVNIDPVGMGQGKASEIRRELQVVEFGFEGLDEGGSLFGVDDWAYVRHIDVGFVDWLDCSLEGLEDLACGLDGLRLDYFLFEMMG